jgi:D-alanyl-lipoteichoic acid acyltransferase DltB (MBOAT superfamily)
MLFNSSTFVAFFAVVFAAYWSVRREAFRHALLLVASFFFYGFSDFRLAFLLAYVIVVAHGTVLLMRQSPEQKKTLLTVGLVLELGQLAVFKYTTFALDSLRGALALLGLHVSPPAFHLLLPVGISFFTFQAISYMVDAYRDRIETVPSWLSAALYVAFFPQLLAGPIVRATHFLPQLATEKRLDGRMLMTGLKLALIGLIYKAVFADRIGPLVDPVLNAPEKYDAASLRFAVLGYYAQIYFDFAGYSTMAIGISRLFGFRIPRNFDYPYRSASVTEFWRRWHIALSTWLRDYLYIPLGGNRVGKLKQYRNLFLTMLLGGLWHGASWNFVLWGALHGGALALHKRLTESAWTRLPEMARWVVGLLATQLFVLVCWIPFRASSFSDTWTVLRGVFAGTSASGLEHVPFDWIVVLPLLADHVLLENKRLPSMPWLRHAAVALVLIGLFWAIALPLLKLDVQSFIYFQF